MNEPVAESDAPTATRTVSTVEELVQLVELVGLRTYELSGKRTEPAPITEPSEPAEPQMSMQIMENHAPDRIETRFRATVEAADGDFVADVSVQYKFDEPLALSPEAIEGFLERVAIMAAWPFIREGVATTAARMEMTVPVMGLMKQGGFKVQHIDA